MRNLSRGHAILEDGGRSWEKIQERFLPLLDCKGLEKRRLDSAETHLEALAALPAEEAQAVMSSSVGCQVQGRPSPQACCKAQLDSTHPCLNSGCCTRTVSEFFGLRCI